MVSVKAAYAIDKQWSVSLGYDYLSGSDGKGDKFKAFDPLYGTHHKFYGAMDYFYASAWQGVAPGLQDAQLGVNFQDIQAGEYATELSLFCYCCQAG